MRLLVTGGAGYIGSHTSQALLALGHDVFIIDNLTTGFAEAVPVGAKFIQGDVRDQAALVALLRAEKIEAVLHFAAKLSVAESVEKPLEYFDNNVVGTLRLLQACAETGVRKMVFSSTAAVYGEGTGAPLSESDPVSPINPYGQTKLASEMMLADWAKANPEFRYVALRYFNVAGASMAGGNGQRSKVATHLIKIACQVATGKRAEMEVFGTDYPTIDGTCVRDYIHIDDLAAAHIVALQGLNNGHAGGVFNCGYGRGASVREVIDMVRKVSGREISARESRRRPGDPATLTSDPERLKREFGWRPQFDSLEVICRSAYLWEASAAARG